MQVLKKFSFLFFCIALAACSTTEKPKVVANGGADVINTEISEINISGSSSFRVGVLLPLSGQAAKQGQGLRNAPC